MLFLTLCITPLDAHAYIGPGAGLSAIGSFLALVAAVVAAIFGFLWYPIKRMVRSRKANASDNKEN
ncbi:hypothetical protein GM415_03430 [Pseudodesulfovibrio cashew]|uniref:Uncharacterized protein n=1 Tax=Pseudodesulfovibrio cashew TaxID=2678688 RepID=A0A6I6JPN2_9BACT|nr:hypothetical protein GM415_03430 [Pseudodesulfovibrio cashew]